MHLTEARHELPQAHLMEPGLDFGPLSGRLVLQRFEAFSSSFRAILQFDRKSALRQILLERRHAAATRKSAGDVQQTLSRTLGPPEEICIPTEATPATGRMTWRRDGWEMHLIGFDDLGPGILTEDPDRGDPLDIKPIGRSRDERFRGRQQRSLPRRILIRIHGAQDALLRPPPCSAN
ncbi:hypothetical protein NUH88_17590 [Nisaea acidiphila]|uniref:Uncharacterized protein n=1 Tax=Nisaea acidiphila TaxID=1862145 RepID=A0A9J7APW7_9PROT|nr:hypothetical protein [Nisaea acidiphila]UUX49206.1 hypothetical protein NUH88_17590 [Nisaea acidiphila]